MPTEEKPNRHKATLWRRKCDRRCPTTCLCELRTILKVIFLSMSVQRDLVSRCTTQGWDYPVTIIYWCNYHIVFKISLKYCYFQNFKDKTEELFLKYWPILDLNWPAKIVLPISNSWTYLLPELQKHELAYFGHFMHLTMLLCPINVFNQS